MPLPVNTTSMLTWAYLTGAINEVKPAASFLTNLLFPNERLWPTEVLELSYLSGNRKLAPFVTINGEAKTVPGRSVTFANVMAPNIAIKRPMQAYQAMLRRAPGTNIFTDSGTIQAVYRDAIAEDIQILSDMVTNRKEWMAAQMATYAKIDYTAGAPDTEQDKFDVTLPRLAAFGGNTGVALTGNARWRHGAGYSTEGTTSDPLVDFDNAKAVMQKEGFIPRMALMGREAARWFRLHSKVRPLIPQYATNIGTVDYKAQYTEQGAMLVARDFCGIEVWEYSQTYEDDAGAEQYFLPPDAVLFISEKGISENVTYYGAIPDHELFQNGQYMTKMFSKSWIQQNPSVLIQMAQTRPLPFCRRPNGIYTLLATQPS
jgi:Phage major capsid protein E